MKLLFACDSEMLTILRYLNIIRSELPVNKYPLASSIIQLFFLSRSSNRCQVFKDAVYATHLNNIASKEKLHSFRKLISKEQNMLFQAYTKKLYQTIGLIAVATLVVVILSLVVENNQIINYTYNGLLAIACSYIIYHGNRTLLEIDKFDAYKRLVKLAEFQD